VIPLLGYGCKPRSAVTRDEQRLGARPEDAVAPLELGAVDGKVGLVDELVRVGSVLGETGHTERNGRPDRLIGRIDLERLLGDGAPDAVGDLDRLLRRGLGQEDGELLAAEAGRHVVVAQMPAEDVRDAAQNRVARQVAV